MWSIRGLFVGLLGIGMLATGAAVLSTTSEAKAAYTSWRNNCTPSYLQVAPTYVLVGCAGTNQGYGMTKSHFSDAELERALKVLEAAYLAGQVLDIRYDPNVHIAGNPNAHEFDLLSMTPN
jgi:hypothetical protein